PDGRQEHHRQNARSDRPADANPMAVLPEDRVAEKGDQDGGEKWQRRDQPEVSVYVRHGSGPPGVAARGRWASAWATAPRAAAPAAAPRRASAAGRAHAGPARH